MVSFSQLGISCENINTAHELNRQSVNIPTTHWHQRSKKVKAHPVPHRLLWQHPSSANPPISHLTRSSHSITHLSITHTPFSLPPCPKGLPHPFRSCVASTQCPAATWQGRREWHHRDRKGNRQRLFPARTCTNSFQERGKIISEAPR